MSESGATSRPKADRYDLKRALATRLLRGQPTALMVHGVLGAAAVAFLWGAAPRTLILGWAGALALAIAARGIGYRLMMRRPTAPDAVLQRLRLLIVGTGIAWGVGVALLTSDLTVPQWALLLTVLAGLVSPAMTTLDADPVSFRLFLVATLGPLPVAVLSRGMLREHVFAVFLIPVFAAFTWLINRQLHAMLVRHLLVASRLAESEEQARRATAAKAAFLASMSHEIRTPLNGVIGMTELLLDTPLSTTQTEYAETVRKSAESLLLIINDVLDYSKIEAGELRLEAAPFDLEIALKDVTDLVGASARAKGLELALRIAPGTPRHVVGDVTRLRQVLTNLVGNAVKFTHDGHVLVEVAAEGRDDGAVRCRFAVEDTGIGIPAEKQRRIFERFTQADASTTRRYGGTGLGLAISKQLVERMGGRIAVESVPGRGSTFSFTLQLPVSEEIAAPLAGSLDGLRALIVDDRAVNRRILAEQLTGWGARSDAVASVAEALEALRSARRASDPYIIGVLDYQLPDGDGLALARELRADHGFDNLALVVVSSIGDRPDDESGGEVDGWLVKPARPSALYNALVDALARRGTGVARAAPVRRTKAPSARPRLAGRVLVAEDNVVNQKVIVALLEKLGCRADLASNGREAVDQIERFPYDLVLMDCEMPEMDGFAATAEIRRREAGTGRRVPIVALTAYAMTGARERCLAAGMDEYLSKPVREPELTATLGAMLPMVPAPPEPVPTASALPAVPAAPILLGDLAGDPDLMREIVDLYRSNAPGWVAEITQALAARDSSALARAAHTLRGALSHLGVPAATEATRALEEAGRAGDLDPAPKALARLETELRHLDESLAALRVRLA